jgi:hypothetical protein
MPLCNLLETVHNKWLQQSGNLGNNMFVATYNDKIRAVMQMTNYIKGYLLGTSPSRQELKLRAAQRRGNPIRLLTPSTNF